MTDIPTRFRVRRDTQANWFSVNPVLLLGEPAITTDTPSPRVKYGDGVTAWNSLPYADSFDHDLIPSADNAYDLGTAAARIKKVFVTQILLGTGVQITTRTGTSTATAKNQVADLGSGASNMISRFSADANPGRFFFVKSRGTTVNTWVATVSNDNLGEFSWAGSDGIQACEGARLRVLQDGTCGATYNSARMEIVVANGTALVIAASFRPDGSTVVGGSVRPSLDNSFDLGSGSLRFREIFCANNVINTSDERMKRDIEPINDALLDAWANVDWIAYRWKDAYAEKGNAARWHFGLIAQHVRDVIDASFGDGKAVRMGIVCHDTWGDEPEIIGKDGETIQHARKAGERWGLRYAECQAIENAYQRREIAALKQSLAHAIKPC